MRIAVLGPGGVGGLLAAVLAAAGHEVLCLAGADTVEVLRRRGVALISERFGDRREPVDAVEVLDRRVDACLVTVKATHLADAVQRVPAAVLGGALLVPLLNGLEHVTALRVLYPRAVVPAAAIRVESTRTGPGSVRHDSPFASVELSSAPGTPRLAAAFRAAGLDARVRRSEQEVLWDKLVFLAPLALLTTSARLPVGDVRVQRRRQLEAVVGEVAAVARACGADGDAAAVLDAVDALPAMMRTSMQRDAESGRPLELDAVGGAVLRAGARRGVDLPCTARLVAEIAGATACGAHGR